MTKYYVDKKDIGKNGPGQYVYKDGKRIRCVTVTGKSLTEQTHRKQCDINYILRDYAKTGLLRHAREHAGKYDDFTVQDFQNAMFLVTNAQNMFNELPSEMRNRFKNDPAQFYEFAQNPANAAEMQKLGMLKGNDGLTATGAPSGAPTAPPAEPPAKPETPPQAPTGA